MRSLDFTSLMPKNSTVVEKALERSMFRATNLEASIDGMWDPENCHESLLPYLAVSLGVEFWNSEWPADFKRQMIQKYIYIRRVRGTFAALATAFDALGATITIREWWEDKPQHPGARDNEARRRPFYFEVNLFVRRNSWIVNKEAVEQIKFITNRLKPLRTHYDLNIIYNESSSMAISVIGRVTKIARFVVEG